MFLCTGEKVRSPERWAVSAVQPLDAGDVVVWVPVERYDFDFFAYPISCRPSLKEQKADYLELIRGPVRLPSEHSSGTSPRTVPRRRRHCRKEILRKHAREYPALMAQKRKEQA